MKPCPICDLKNSSLDPVAAFALGVGVGVALGSMSAATATVCDTHRIVYMMGALQATCSAAASKKEGL